MSFLSSVFRGSNSQITVAAFCAAHSRSLGSTSAGCTGGSVSSWKTLGPVLKLSPEKVKELIETRLLAQDTDRGYFGCASTTGFLAKGECLFQVAKADEKTLKEHCVNYRTIAAKLSHLIRSAQQGVPVLVEGRFEVAMEPPTLGFQHCPFAPEDDKGALPWSSYNRTCPKANTDYTVTNKRTGASFCFGGLLPHLIGEHGFFLSPKVPHRVDPKKVIEVLELPPEIGGFVELESSAHTVFARPSWHFLNNRSFMKPVEKGTMSTEELTKGLTEDFKMIAEGERVDPPEWIMPGLFRLKLPYSHTFYGQPVIQENPNNFSYSHFVNVTPEPIRFSQNVDGVLLDVCFYPYSAKVTLLTDK